MISDGGNHKACVACSSCGDLNSPAGASSHHHHRHAVILILPAASAGDGCEHIRTNTTGNMSSCNTAGMADAESCCDDTCIDTQAIHADLVICTIVILLTCRIILSNSTYNHRP